MSQPSLINNNTGLFPAKQGDWLFILALPLIAILSGMFVSFNPDYFFLVLMLDLWLLGYHHVISTFTRTGFDAKSAKEHWVLLFPLPLAIFCAVIAVYQLGGAIILGSVYLYWQWYHYSRQSEGISKSYGFKCADNRCVHSKLNRTLFYLVPLTSFVYMISSGPTDFLNIPIFTFTLAEELRWTLLVTSYVAALYWLLNATIALWQKRLSIWYFAYMVSHFSIYLVAYTCITEIDYGWLTVNIWHNAQYIGFVWLFNRKRYAAGFDKHHPIISFISQPNRLFIYLGSCLILSLLVYWLIDKAIYLSGVDNKIALIFIVYSAINFHHYIVDSQIWKLRKPQIQNTITE
jgi:hypothetical protein